MIDTYVAAAAALFLAGNWLPSRRISQALMLGASYLIYFNWAGGFLAVLVLSTLVNFALAAAVRRRPSGARLWAAIAFNLILLGVFKYTTIFSAAVPQAGVLVTVAGPIGISFWTFQAISYSFDLYSGEELDPSLLEFALYLAFWPTVILGPICRLPGMLSQFRQPRISSLRDVQRGLYRVVLGLFMKLVCAQVLASGWMRATGVSAGFDAPRSAWSGTDVWFLAIGFGFQLFFDFAAYSHIVIGAARMLGFRLDENFQAPYLAETPSEFWQRWHMSLSSWIRDYVFLPLSVIRREPWWRYGVLVFSMTLFGAWHGSTATFVGWGAYNGVLLVAHRLGQNWLRQKGRRLAGPVFAVGFWAVTFGLINLGWVLFRAHTWGQAMAMYRAVITPSTYRGHSLPQSFYVLVLVMAGSCLAVQMLAPLARRRRRALPEAAELEGFIWGTRRWLMIPPIAILIAYAYLLGAVGDGAVTPFVYRLF